MADISGEQIARMDSQPLENVAGTYGFQIAQQGHELISDVYLSKDEQALRLTVFRPITRNSELEPAGQVVGVLVAEVDFSRIQTILQLLTLPPDETAAIFAPDGQVIAHSQTTELATLPALTDMVLKKALVSKPTGISENYVDELGREVIGIHAPVEELRWVVVIQTPLTKLEAETAALRRTMIIGLVAGLALAITTGWLMARRLTRPVEQLASAAERVAAGDLSVSVDVSASNELGRLAGTFNQMVVKMRQAQEALYQNENRLEELVNLRTGELQTTNQKLAQELAGHKKTQEALIKVLDNTEILFWHCDRHQLSR